MTDFVSSITPQVEFWCRQEETSGAGIKTAVAGRELSEIVSHRCLTSLFDICVQHCCRVINYTRLIGLFWTTIPRGSRGENQSASRDIFCRHLLAPAVHVMSGRYCCGTAAFYRYPLNIITDKVLFSWEGYCQGNRHALLRLGPCAMYTTVVGGGVGCGRRVAGSVGVGCGVTVWVCVGCRCWFLWL